MATDTQNKTIPSNKNGSSLGWGLGCGCLGVITAVLLAIAIWIVGGSVMLSVMFLAPLEFSGFLQDNGDPFVVIMTVVTITLALLGGGLGYLGGLGIAALLRRN